jgi:hypothetical protein
LESGERRGNKISNLDRTKKDIFKNKPEYTQNIPESAKNSNKIGPISVGCIGHKI